MEDATVEAGANQTNDCMVVALTGGIAAGKTAVSDRFATLGIPVIDTDLLAREVVRPGSAGLATVVSRFGAHMLNPDGTLDRRALRAHVFEDDSRRRDLERILHPEIMKRLQERVDALSRSTAAYCIVVIPLLAETGVPELVDRVLLVTAPEDIRKARLVKRDNLTEEAATRMLSAQASDAERREIADDVIVNDDLPARLDEQIGALHERYLDLTRPGERRH